MLNLNQQSYYRRLGILSYSTNSQIYRLQVVTANNCSYSLPTSGNGTHPMEPPEMMVGFRTLWKRWGGLRNLRKRRCAPHYCYFH